jgi:hypothetical protein
MVGCLLVGVIIGAVLVPVVLGGVMFEEDFR